MRHAIIFFALLLTSLAALGAPADDVWMSVLLNGRKIGHMHNTRQVQGEHVITAQSMDVELDRAGIKVALSTSETDTETRDGKPLAFASRTAISGIASTINGTRRDDGRFNVVSEVGGAKQTRIIAWPQGALLAEGLRLAELHGASKFGAHFTQLAFQIQTLDAVPVESTIGAREQVDLPDGSRTLTRIEQLIHLPGAATHSVAWVDADETVQKLVMPLMGYDLTMLACSKTCANAPNQSTDILAHAMVHAPAALSTDELQHGLILQVSASNGNSPLEFAQTSEQRATPTAHGIELRIAPLAAGAPVGPEDAPTPADSQPNDWLQSDVPAMRALARMGAGDATTASTKMHNLQEFVRRFIRTKDLNVGYASALEVLKNPEGDCTEHAVLLAALGRALGIPTRVVDGLAYTDHYAGADHVFVPHAWTQAYVDGRWQSFDAALPGFDAGHIALSVGDGDPWRFFAGMNTLGRLRIESVTPLH